jgi:hypothetical protein
VRKHDREKTEADKRKDEGERAGENRKQQPLAIP